MAHNMKSQPQVLYWQNWSVLPLHSAREKIIQIINKTKTKLFSHFS